MISSSLRAAHRTHAVRVLIGACSLLVSIPLYATVTWDGVDGVSMQVFQAYCTTCHSATPTGGNVSQSPYWTSYANVVSDLGSIRDHITGVVTPIMPPGGLSAPQKTAVINLLDAWSKGDDGIPSTSDDTPLRAAPDVSDALSDYSAEPDAAVGKATLHAGINGGGQSTSFNFEWEQDDGSSVDAFANTTPTGAASTGGGTQFNPVSQEITIVQCHTTYQFRIQATNASGTTTGTTKTFIMPACTSLDADSDGWTNVADNCPDDANPDQADLDGDSVGDSCDPDIDGDGVSNDAENTIPGMDPTDPTDAAIATQDLDGDGVTNIAEYNNCQAAVPAVGVAADAGCTAINNPLVPPVVAVSDLQVTATGYVTAVALGATAEDGFDSAMTPTADKSGPFRPGHYDITWTATDSRGYSATPRIQSLDVFPLVRLGGSQMTGEGQTLTVPITLNGDAPSYPVDIQYEVTGTAGAADHDLVSGTLTINSGRSGELTIHINDDGVAEPDETFIITLTGVSSANAALSDAVQFTGVITETALAPVVELTATQSGVQSRFVYQDQGDVTVTADATDGNGDVLTYTWSAAGLDGTSADNQFTFDPASSAVTTGAHAVNVDVSDGVQTVHRSIMLVVGEFAPVLDSRDSDKDGTDDVTEGRGDADGDGLPDYLDPVDDVTLLNPRVSATHTNFSRLLTTTAGLSLALNDSALAAQDPAAGKVGARIFVTDVRNAGGGVVYDTGNAIVGGVYDFEIHGFSDAQRVAQVVIPLTQSIPAQAQLRKFDGDTWSTFVTSATDEVRSAASVAGECPAPGNFAYQSGLVPFFDCLELTLTDGGANDADAEVNGVIRDPGAVVVPAGGATENSASDSSPGGSGALDRWWLIMLAPLLLTHRRFR